MRSFDPKVISLHIERRNGFTFSDHPARWAVVKGDVDPAEQLMAALRFLKRDRIEEDLGSVDGVAAVLDALLRIESRTRRARAIRELCRAGLVLYPFGAISSKNRFILPKLLPDRSFLRAFDEVASVPLDRRAKHSLCLLWMSTTEGRDMPRSAETVEKWVHSHLSPDRRIKWISGLGYTGQSNLVALGAAFRVNGVTRKGSPNFQTHDAAALQPWKRDFSSWIEEKNLASTSNYWASYSILARYLVAHPQCCDPRVLFGPVTARPSIVAWSQPLNVSRAQGLRRVEEFLRWFAIKNGMATVDDWSGETILQAGLSWPFGISDHGAINVATDSSRKPSQSVQLSLPLEFILDLERILLEDDMAWPKTRGVDWISGKDGETVFCPVMPTLILILLKLPIRTAQVRRLDSGEGDAGRFDLTTKTWTANDGPHANHWVRRGAKNRERGVLRRIRDTWTGSDLCGFYINSNKTRDRKVLFSEESGYEISWQNEDVIQLLQKMRAWQETNNAVAGPLRYVDLRPRVFEKATDSVAKRRPDVFYLFRYPGGNFGSFKDNPPTSQQLRMYWLELLGELERRLESKMSVAPRFIDTWIGKSPQSSSYGLHGLRVGGLTRLALAGVHPWILQNVVAGHSKFVMTLYYIKPGAAFVSHELSEKYSKAMAERQHEFSQFLATSTMDKVRELGLARNPDAFTDLSRSRGGAGAAIMARLDHGICPNGRTRCDEGMRLIDRTGRKPREARNVFGPVPPCVGTDPDCTRCRFFITGSPFVEGMRIRTNEVAYAAHKSAQRQQNLLRRIDAVEERWLENRTSKYSIDDERDLARLRQELKVESDVLGNLSESLHAHGELFQLIRGLLDHSGEARLIVADGSEVPTCEWGLVPRFDALDDLCRNARWFIAVRDESLQRERREMVFKLLTKCGRPLEVATLSDEEINSAIDQLVSDLRRRLQVRHLGPLIDSTGSIEARVEKIIVEASAAANARLVAVARVPRPDGSNAEPTLPSLARLPRPSRAGD